LSTSVNRLEKVNIHTSITKHITKVFIKVNHNIIAIKKATIVVQICCKTLWAMIIIA
ncbi:hypothetical protein ACJX0J_016327, partial [Zea mays]